MNYNIYHIGLGAAFNVARWDLVVGGVYAFGKDKLQNAITTIADDVSSDLINQLAGSNVVFNRIRVLFGFSYAL